MVEIKTERLLLRPISIGDAGDLWRYMSDPLISEKMSWAPHSNINETVSFIQNCIASLNKQTAIHFVVIYDNRIIGLFSLISIIRAHRSLIYDKAEIAYWVGTEHSGNGFMTEAGKAVLRYGFDSFKLNKIIVGHHHGNEASKRLIKRLGFSYTHTEKRAFKKMGEWIDVDYYSLENANYNEGD